MQGIREYNRKIDSLRSTRKITGSMKMISSAKMQRFVKVRQAASPFWKGVHRMIAQLTGLGAESDDVLLAGNRESQTSLIVLITGDRGMCGQYNKNAIRKAIETSEALSAKGRTIAFSCVGARGHTALNRRQLPIANYYEGLSANPDFQALAPLATECFDGVLKGTYHDVWVVYTRRASSLVEEAIAERLLPFKRPAAQDGKVSPDQVLVEEGLGTVLSSGGLLLVQGRLHEMATESVFSEHAARVSAMDSATANCDRMIDKYLQLRNRARQTAITTELTEIVTGKEALEA